MEGGKTENGIMDLPIHGAPGKKNNNIRLLKED
jgi:hypothetical protein